MASLRAGTRRDGSTDMQVLQRLDGKQSSMIHSLNGFRLHQTAMYLESQTQFGDILRPRKASAGVFLDSTQSVADRVRVADKRFSCTAHGPIVVLPHPKRGNKHLPVLIGKVAKTVQRSAGGLDHHLRR